MKTSPPDIERRYALRSLARYWPTSADLIKDLQAFAGRIEPGVLPPRLVDVALPDWAADAGPTGRILVPQHLVLPGEEAAWTRTDWLGAAYWYLHGCAEREHESRFGPIHSYAYRLPGWDDRMWSHAWVNRIALFLRRWASQRAGADEDRLFGPRPRADVLVTHDVDALRKTAAIRVKQCAFNAFNAARALMAGRPRTARARIVAAARFLASRSDYDCLDELLKVEERHGIRSRFHVFAGRPTWRNPSSALMDPGYDIEDPPARIAVRKIMERGLEVGLHPSFNAWGDAGLLAAERARLERVVGAPVSACRQHWLRFSWSRTWSAQARAGLELDATLGFNDRPGFRNGAALVHTPLDEDGRELPLQAVPLVLMDSHLYDYQLLEERVLHEQLERWVEEIQAVGGVATVLWHPHTLASDYGWAAGFHALADALRARP